MKDTRIDNYILNANDFAKPILIHLRNLLHSADSEIEETIKWGFPHFIFHGKTLCYMAAFNQHCAFGFKLAALMTDTHHIFLKDENKSSMGDLGKIQTIRDLPSKKILLEYIKQAITLIEDGTKPKKKPLKSAESIPVPDDLSDALRINKKANTTFLKFSNSHKNEYILWIIEAKRIETRKKRIETAVEWLAEGKDRNWKY